MKPQALLLASLTTLAIFAAPAMAADLRRPMPVKAPPPVAAPAFTWTGCYVGAHAGYASGKKRAYNILGDEIDDFGHTVDGLVAGGQIGCNLWQSERWVFGIEGQASWADVDGESSRNPQIVTEGLHTDIDIIGSIAARLGYAFGATGQTLAFVKGGAAFVREDYVMPSSIPEFEHTTDQHLRWGWMAGAGVEQALSSNWSVKAEYNFSDFGRHLFDFRSGFCGGDVCARADIKQHMHVVKVGINYRFGGFGGPVVARY